jgi:hypothetical protein
MVGIVATCQRATLSMQPNAFTGKTKTRVPLTWASTSNVIKWALEQMLWLEGSKKQLGGKLDLVPKNNIKWLSNIFKLPY